MKTWFDWLPGPPAPSSAGNMGLSRLEWSFCLLIPLFNIILVWVYGVNVPFWDEWDLIAFFEQSQHRLDFQALWHQHNEHRVVWVKLLYWVYWKLGMLDLRLVMITSQLLLASTLPLILLELKKIASTPVVLMLCSMWILTPVHHTNVFWAFQFQWYALWAFAMLNLAMLCQENLTPRRFAMACLAGMGAMLCTLGGVVVLANGLILLSLRNIRTHRQVKYTFTWLVFSIGCVIVYWWNLEPSVHSGSSTSILTRVLNLLIFLPSLLANTLSTQHLPTALAIGVLGLIALVVLLIRGAFRERLFVWGMIQLSLLFCAAVSLGRSNIQSSLALSSHYALLTVPFWIGLLSVVRWRGKVGGILALGLVLVWLNTAQKAWKRHLIEHDNRTRGTVCHQVSVQHPELVRPDQLPWRDCKFLFPDRHEVHKRIPVFEELGLRFDP